MALVDETQLDLLRPKRKKAKPPKVFDLGWVSSNGVVRCCLPIKLESSANKREHWRDKHARAAAERNAAWVSCKSALNSAPVKLHFPIMLRIGGDKVAVKITRFGPRAIDTDNLSISAKAVRDGIADALELDDSPNAPVTWECSQEKTTKGYAVGVEIRCLH